MLPFNQETFITLQRKLADRILSSLYLGLTSNFQQVFNHCNEVWLWQGAKCSLLVFYLTEICPRHITRYSTQSHYTDTGPTCFESLLQMLSAKKKVAFCKFWHDSRGDQNP